MRKEVYTIRGDDVKVEMKECIPRRLPFSSKYIAPYWYAAIRNVFEYDKMRGLQTIHKLTSDDRIEAGYQLYKNKHIKEIVVTKYAGGDVRAVVLSEDKTDEYTVIIKNFLPEKLPQYNFEREDFIANLLVSCTCADATISKYKDNSSMIDKHTAAVIWFLIDRFGMPKIFVLPEERMLGYQKSDVEELEVEIKSMPLVKFRCYINLLLLKNFRNMKPGLSISIHRISNENDEEIGKPTWLTMIESKDVERLLRGISKAYRAMSASQEVSEQDTDERLCTLLGIKPKVVERVAKRIVEVERKPWWRRWWHG